MYSRYFDPVVREVPIQVNLRTIIIYVHHTADCTDFVLVYEREAYYDHRHSGIDETNILQVYIAAEGETVRSG